MHKKDANGKDIPIPDEDIQKNNIIPRVLALRNPFYGYMNFDNKRIYFDPIIKYINELK